MNLPSALVWTFYYGTTSERFSLRKKDRLCSVTKSIYVNVTMSMIILSPAMHLKLPLINHYTANYKQRKSSFHITMMTYIVHKAKSTDRIDYYSSAKCCIQKIIIITLTLWREVNCEVLWWVCLAASYLNSKTTRPNFTNFFVHVACGSSSVILWPCCVTKNDTDVAHYNFNDHQPIMVILL